MRCTSFSVVLLCIFKCIQLVLAICTVSKHEAGLANRLQCSNVTLQAASNQTSGVSALLVFNSDLRYIPERAFARHTAFLQILNIHDCHINDIHPSAFDGLVKLKKLSLPSNKITRVKEEWFKDLAYLEQLDLSFNEIDMIVPAVFDRILRLRRLDVRENRLSCLDPSVLPGSIEKVYFVGNPLTFSCRGKLTLWMRDHYVSYKTELSEKEAWLEKLLWLCAIGDASVAESELLMKECVILNLFNQLRTGLSSAESYPLNANCANERDRLMDCIVSERYKMNLPNNGNVIKKLLLYIQRYKSNV